MKPSPVQMVMLDGLDCGIPCGKHRKEIAAMERTNKLEFGEICRVLKSSAPC